MNMYAEDRRCCLMILMERGPTPTLTETLSLAQFEVSTDFSTDHVMTI